jgi:hypothetical protein
MRLPSQKYPCISSSFADICSINIKFFGLTKLKYIAPNIAVEWVAALLIREAPGSNLGQEIGCPWRIFCGFPQLSQANYRIIPEIMLGLLT